MDYLLLRSWLGLPPGPWPLDHYALLGLAPGPYDPGAVERLVLARMDRIRPHQLLHPDLVTEGMNRLAQALVCLTDPVARAAYDAELGLPASAFGPSPADQARTLPGRTDRGVATKSAKPQPQPPYLPGKGASVPPVYEPIPGFPIPTDDPEPLPADVTQVIDVRFEPGLQPPEPLPPAYEIVESQPPEPLPPAYEVVRETEVAPPAPTLEVVEAQLVSLPPQPPWEPATRRQLYARLATVRRLIEAWQKFKPILGDPQSRLDRPIRVLAFLEAVAEMCPLLGSLPSLFGGQSQHGGLVATLLRQPLVLDTFRTLLPDQRRAVALDWGRADRELIREYSRLRELARSGRPFRRRYRARWRLLRLFRWAIRNPEAILLVLALGLVIAALFRVQAARAHFLFP